MKSIFWKTKQLLYTSTYWNASTINFPQIAWANDSWHLKGPNFPQIASITHHFFEKLFLSKKLKIELPNKLSILFSK
jgi:hypothetical protein